MHNIPNLFYFGTTLYIFTYIPCILIIIKVFFTKWYTIGWS